MEHPTEDQRACYKARGKCGGAFQEGSRMVMLSRDADGGLFVVPAQFAHDAAAPCFEPDEPFYSCPVAQTAAPFTVAAFRWHARAEKGMLGTLGPLDKLSARCVAAIDEVTNAVARRRSFELDKIERKRRIAEAKRKRGGA